MTVRTDIHYSILMSEYNAKVGRWGGNLIQAARARAIINSPRRGRHKTENLWAQHRATTKFRLGGNAYRIGLVLENNASYARYVHEGTKGINGFIFPNHDYFVFPGSEIGKSRKNVRLEYVKGQPAKPWLREALQTQLRVAGVPKQVRQLQIGRG